MEKLNLNHLFYFYVTAKEGSIKEASEKLHVTQPTISDQIKLLEEFLDTKLFERKHRTLFLTHQGELALQYAEKIFDLSLELTSMIRNKEAQPKNSLEIGITHFMSQYLLYENILPLFEKSEISVKIREDDRRYLLADLEENKIDMLFTDTKESISSTMDSYRIGTNRTFVVAHNKFKNAKKNFPISLEDIPYFGYTSDSFLKYEINLFFSKIGIAPRTIGEADDIDLHYTMTEKGLAFTIVPEVAKNRFKLNSNLFVLGEIKELQTSVYGIIKKSYKGLGYQFLNDKL